jgi:hypothetical protein
MSELVALSKLAVLQHRWTLGLLAVAVLASQLVMATLLAVGVAADHRALIAISFFYILLPAGLAGIILFHFSRDGDLASPASGCSHWVLRMPLKAWKIALTPVVLKTLWMSVIWMLTAQTFARLGEERLPLLAPVLCFSAAAIWLSVIAWLPLRVGWHRLILLALLFIAFYLMLGLVFGGPLRSW